MTLCADVGNDLNSTYWYLWCAKDATTYVIWYNVSCADVDPVPATASAHGVATSIPVDIATGDADTVVATATVATINTLLVPSNIG